ncbi:MAG: ATP-dependent zinc protease [Proteobacteria bacterium]|nr:ATP-dependent zinc protease [Pseudomonadota bacterium]
MRVVLFKCLVLLFLCQSPAFASVLEQKFGQVEHVLLLPENLKLVGKMDTGAKTSSLDAIDITEFERNGETWVRFTVPLENPRKGVVFERKLEGYTHIKRRKPLYLNIKKEAPMKRPVVKIMLCIGNEKYEEKFNLANRSDFLYPVLIGRSTIAHFNGVVDPQEKFITHLNCE